MASNTPAIDALISSSNDPGAAQAINQGAQEAEAPVGVSTPAIDALIKSEQAQTIPQQALTVAEGLGEGFAGPIKTATEAGLTKLGVPGLTPEDQEARAEANPIEHIGSNLAGFVGGGATGFGEAALLGKIGEGATLAADFGNGVNKIAATGIKAGAELSALQAGDEISKAINQDPNQTIGSAAINVGLSGLIGGAGGAAIGSVSPLFKTAANKIGIGKLATDFQGETKYLQENPDLVEGATKELTSRMQEADSIKNSFNDIKSDAVQKLLPEVTPESNAKIDEQIQGIYNSTQEKLTKAAGSVKTKAAVPYLAEDFDNWQKAISQPDATPADKFLATNEFKRTLQSYPTYGLTEEVGPRAVIAKELASEIQPLLEDKKVWGAAADIQKVSNKAASLAASATKDLGGAVLGKELGERVVDPRKVQTFLNQTQKGSGGLRENKIYNYLKYTQEQADAINKVHIENGLEAPLNSTFNPTPILDRTLNTPISPGRTLAQWAHTKGAGALANAVGEGTSSVIGGGLGALVGHPLLGAWAAEKILSPVMSVLAKPFAEQAVNSEAMRSSVDYMANAVKGEFALDNATKAFFKNEEIVPKNLMPSEGSRSTLEKAIEHNQNPDNMLNISGNINHYLPNHATAIAATAANALNYINTINPKVYKSAPLDNESPKDRFQVAKYNRTLDIAQQPLLVLQHAKNGTLTSDDVQSLNTIFPGLKNNMVSKLNEALIEHKAAGGKIPYDQRVALNLLIGAAPLDSTMTPMSAQAIIHSASPPQSTQSGGVKKTNNPSSAALGQINKVNQLYQTSLQSRAAQKRD
jgi:hypothetical protein